MKIPDFRYRSSDIFGDDLFHSVCDLDNIHLSRKNPLAFHIGDALIKTASPVQYTKIKSSWLWRYNFTSANSSRFYGSSSIGSNGTTSITSLNVGITSTSTYYSVGDSSAILEAYITSGSSTITSTKLESIRFSSYNNWYFTPSITYPSSSSNRAIVCRFKEDYSADLPSDIYTISGSTVTWDIEHPVYKLLEGQECFPY